MRYKTYCMYIYCFLLILVTRHFDYSPNRPGQLYVHELQADIHICSLPAVNFLELNKRDCSGFRIVKMSNHRSLILFIWYMLSICLVTVGAQNCYGTENFTTDGAYAKNREILLSSLSSNVVRSDGFFYPTETGEDPDKVYGYALCRGYASAEECSSCVNTTSEKIMVECPYQKEAYRWDGIPTCLVRYSDQPILGQAKAGISNDVYNTGSISSNWTDFDERWANFVNSTIKEASAGSSTLKFARNEEELPWDFAKMYALMQCTPDLSQRTCSDCLRERANKYRTIAPGKQGGIFNSPSCIFRWELYSFLTPPPESTNDTSVATSPPAPGSNKRTFLFFQ